MSQYMECPNCKGGGGFVDGMCMVCNGYGKATQREVDERWDGTCNASDDEEEGA